MTPLQLSSNDLLADRRADYAEMLFASGDHAAAAELMLGALELAPNWAMGWFRAGEMHEAAGQAEAAAAAWRMSLKLEPADRPGATLKLQLIGAAPAADSPPSAFVETLFDQYADKFDHALVDTLHYRVPELLNAAVAATGRARFAHAVDLGCGTGLMGVKLRPVASRLVGYDISAEMLRKARDKGVYDSLVKADLQELRPEGEQADLVTAADVFMYVGALDRIFATVTEMLAPAGIFAFSVERYAGEGAFELQPSRRYAHSEAYVHGLIAAAGLTLVSLERAVIRQDRREPVEGLIVVTERAA
ncbi:methyltransferase domain-containing protein [Aminobacter niigataensis]|uniref:methyltransferase domain-containing protein n=1 Tax=Aminobacter niigataensis TaxID=83265 RepID=UPI0024CCA640|nr:methyltransferase domain-containing protein [Aminobacter niigataensis]CAI2936226.1 Malonyl-CoA O-methyltransferase BioC [Aminobacter niigataensis]